MNRRLFIQTAALSIAVLAVLPSVVMAEERRRGGSAAAAAPVLVDPKESGAKAVNYVHSIKDIKDNALKTERNGVKFEAQNCTNCVFYTKDQETTAGGKKAAPCQMPFAKGKLVAAEGWCSTWAKKG